MNAVRRILAAISFLVAFTAFTVAAYGINEDEQDAEAAPNSVSVTITEETFFSFTPNATGYWTFVTSDNTDGTIPSLWLVNHYDHVLAFNSGSAPGNNAIIKLHLVEGAPYVIMARFEGYYTGSYTLTVFMSEEFVRPLRPVLTPEVIPGDGGVVSDGRLRYSFTPYESGLWLFDLESDDAFLEMQIRDSRGNDIAFNVDLTSWGFHGTVRLTAGEEYIISSWTMLSTISYTLSVSLSEEFVPWVNWDILAVFGLDMDFEADRLVIPSYGGDAVVTESTTFSFTPDETGLWVFSLAGASLRGDVFALITDAYGSFIATVEDPGWRDSWISLRLEEGVEYVVLVSSIFTDNFAAYLTVAAYEEWEPDLEDDYDDSTTPIAEQGVRIPSGGGYIGVTDEDFLFMPEYIGPWSIQVLDAPTWLSLAVIDPSESILLRAPSSSGISVHLAPGVEYTIRTSAGRSILVSPTYEIHPPHGGVHIMRRVIREAEFSFIPAETGYWVIFTSDNEGTTDPYLWLLDAEGNIIASDDDGGEGLNAMIKIHLEAGVRHTIRAGYFVGDGAYTLNVHMVGNMQARELVVLEPPKQ